MIQTEARSRAPSSCRNSRSRSMTRDSRGRVSFARPIDAVAMRAPFAYGDEASGFAVNGTTGASRIGRLMNAAKSASDMSAYHIQP